MAVTEIDSRANCRWISTRPCGTSSSDQAESFCAQRVCGHPGDDRQVSKETENVNVTTQPRNNINLRYEIEEASEFLEPVDKVPMLVDDEDDYQVGTCLMSQIYVHIVSFIRNQHRPVSKIFTKDH